MFCLVLFEFNKVSRVQMILPESELSSSRVLLPQSEPPHLSQHYLYSFSVSDLEFLLALCMLYSHQIKSPLCSNLQCPPIFLEEKAYILALAPGHSGIWMPALAPQSFPLLLSALAAAFAGNTLPQLFTWLPLPLKCRLWCPLYASFFDCCT